MIVTRETNSEEVEIIARQVTVILCAMRQEPTVAFQKLLDRIERENTQIEMGATALARSRPGAGNAG